ncbi:MAG: hypothetical protein R3F61_23680 [Myxococcota bacterium]
MVLVLLALACSSTRIEKQDCEDAQITPDVTAWGGADLGLLMPDGTWTATVPAWAASGNVELVLDATVEGSAHGLTNAACFMNPEAEGDYLVVPVAWRVHSDDGYLDVSSVGEVRFRDDTWRFHQGVDPAEVPEHPFDFSFDDPVGLTVTLEQGNGFASAMVSERYSVSSGPSSHVVFSSNPDLVDTPVR